MFALADKPGDPDPMDWAPPTHNSSNAAAATAAASSAAGAAAASGGAAAAGSSSSSSSGGLPGAVCFLEPGSGAVRLECLWGLPGSWDALHAAATIYSQGAEAQAAA